MKDEDLLQAIGNIDEDLLEDAAAPPKKRRPSRQKWSLAAAAALVVVIGTGIYFMPFTPEKLDLPMLAVSFNSETVGSESCYTYEVTEDGNPWNQETELKALPVYQNTAYSDGAGLPVYHGENAEELLDLAKQTAAALHMEIGEAEYSTDDDGNVYQVNLKTDTAVVKVEGNFHISIIFDEGKGIKLELPETEDHLAVQLGDVSGFQKPMCTASDIHNLNGDAEVSYRIYDTKGNIEEQILNYNFSSITCYPDSEQGNTLRAIHIDHMLSAAKWLGDYPLISEAKARKLLMKGDYLTSYQAKIPGRNAIVKVELVYRANNLQQIFMPYYKYWVEVNGLPAYGIYYVPAIEQQYLE